MAWIFMDLIRKFTFFVKQPTLLYVCEVELTLRQILKRLKSMHLYLGASGFHTYCLSTKKKY